MPIVYSEMQRLLFGELRICIYRCCIFVFPVSCGRVFLFGQSLIAKCRSDLATYLAWISCHLTAGSCSRPWSSEWMLPEHSHHHS